MPKVGGRRKKARSHKEPQQALEKQLPRIFVVKKGDCSRQMQDTVLDLRRCFYPHTSMKLEDTNKMQIKSYIKAAKYYNVTHLLVLQHSGQKNYLRVMKVSGGQMIFRVINYCRMKDVVRNGGQAYSYSFREPLVVLNNFVDNLQVKMIGKALQELFPPINVETIHTERLKRVVVFTYSANKKMIYFRHYKIVVNEGGVSSGFQKLLKQKSLDLSKFKSIGQYLNQLQSDHVQGGQNQQKVSLQQLGPRLKLKFVSYKAKGQTDCQEQQNGLQQEQNDQ